MTRGRSTARLAGWACLLLLGGLLASPAVAQTAGGRPQLSDPTQPNLLLQMQQRMLTRSAEGGLLALEGPLDPETYILGPGDQFGISIGGAVGIEAVVPVSSSGELVLPEAGTIMAAGRTLAEVKQAAETALRRPFRNVDIQITLAQPRAFLVHVAGAVPEPGRYLMLPRARVDDALQQATLRAAVRLDPVSGKAPDIPGSASTERPQLNEAYSASLRNIMLRRGDGAVEHLDLMQYYMTGDLDENPYLLDGDVIEVPTYHLDRGAIRVTGPVAFPGTIDHRPGDSVLDVLQIVSGPNGLDGLGEVRISRRTDDGRTETLVVDVAEQVAGGAPVPLQAGDHLNVIEEERATAAIYGLVEYPGTYPIRDGETTLRGLIDMAGGLQQDANPRAAYIERRKSLAFKQTGAATDLDFFSRSFLQQSLGRNRVVVDLDAALAPGAPDILIFDQDRVVFPRDEGTIFVTGNVPRAGYMDFVEGQTAGYYIDLAGGQGPLTTEVYIFTPDGGMRTGENVRVRLGDTIFVDREDIAESPEMATLLISDQSSKRQARIMRTQTIITGISAITSIITAYVAVRSIN